MLIKILRYVCVVIFVFFFEVVFFGFGLFDVDLIQFVDRVDDNFLKVYGILLFVVEDFLCNFVKVVF